jgi:ATP adenylyltransferase
MCARKKAQNPQAIISPINSTELRRLWTPWRMKYVAHETEEDGCIFCNRLASDNDAKSLILRRTDLAFLIMNLYPYNTGHVMIVPIRHVSGPEDLIPGEIHSMGDLLLETLAAIRRVLNPAGFNVGMNIGAVAGAGVADHLHQHVVPRWQGDANFMPIIAGTMVMPELIQATYAKVRAELERALRPNDTDAVALVILSFDASQVLVTNTGRLPAVDPKLNEPIFGKAVEFVRSHGLEAEFVGWAGHRSTKIAGSAAFAFLASSASDNVDGMRWTLIETASNTLRSKSDIDAIQSALSLDLSVAIAPPD